MEAPHSPAGAPYTAPALEPRRPLPVMTRSSCSRLCSPTRKTSCAALQYFITRQMPIPLCPAQVWGATSMCPPRPNPQPPQISEGETNQNSSDGGTSLSAHWPSSDEAQNNRQYSRWFQKAQHNSVFRIARWRNQLPDASAGLRLTHNSCHAFSANTTAERAGGLWSGFSVGGTSQPIPRRGARRDVGYPTLGSGIEHPIHHASRHSGTR